MNESMPPTDHVTGDQPDEQDRNDSTIEENLKSRSTWLRLLFMILFLALWSISRVVVFTVVVLQFFWVLFAGETNARLGAFGQSLATYSYDIVMYLTFNTEEQPFPFADWPGGPPA